MKFSGLPISCWDSWKRHDLAELATDQRRAPEFRPSEPRSNSDDESCSSRVL